ncbi:MAG: branched-chain amino acid ABC transporter permease [Thiomonas sp.]
MTFDIGLYLGQSGITLGAIYALLALALVLVFVVTRVIFIPQGELMTLGALSLVSIHAGNVPKIVWLLVVLGATAAVLDGWVLARRGHRAALWRALALDLGWPAAALLAAYALPLDRIGYLGQILLALFVTVPLGPLLYRLVYQPVAQASVLTLLLLSVALHLALTSLGLYLFGPEGSRVPAFTDGSFTFAGLPVDWQALWIIGLSVVLVLGLFAFFNFTLYGKALRATAVNRTGAQLMGISTEFAGKLAFTLAALIGALSGILIASTTIIYYDSGFVIGLKGFVAAIIGGLSSYPAAAAGAVFVGLVESFSSFWASAYKDVIVFALILPVLLWRSLGTHHVEEDEA